MGITIEGLTLNNEALARQNAREAQNIQQTKAAGLFNKKMEAAKLASQAFQKGDLPGAIKPLMEADPAAAQSFIERMLGAQAKADSRPPYESAGSKELDKKAAVAYDEFINKGGYAKTARNINVLNDAVKILEGSGNVSGPLQSALPDSLKPFAASKNMNVKDLVSSVVFQSLKDTFPGQISDGERKALVDTAYNPSLSDKVNKARLNTLLNEIKEVGRARIEASRYFEDNGFSMRGYKAASKLNLDVGELQEKLNSIQDTPKSSAPVQASKIKVSNGKEMFEIDPSDLKDAEKDGFKLIK